MIPSGITMPLSTRCVSVLPRITLNISHFNDYKLSYYSLSFLFFTYFNVSLITRKYIMHFLINSNSRSIHPAYILFYESYLLVPFLYLLLCNDFEVIHTYLVDGITFKVSPHYANCAIAPAGTYGIS